MDRIVKTGQSATSSYFDRLYKRKSLIRIVNINLIFDPALGLTGWHHIYIYSVVDYVKTLVDIKLIALGNNETITWKINSKIPLSERLFIYGKEQDDPEPLIEDVNTEISLSAIASTDIVLYSLNPHQFSLENVVFES